MVVWKTGSFNPLYWIKANEIKKEKWIMMSIIDRVLLKFLVCDEGDNHKELT